MAEIATTLEQLKTFLSKFFEHEPYGDEYLKMMLSQYDIKGNEPVDKDLTPFVWLACADILELYVIGVVDYDQGEIVEKIDRQSIMQAIENIRTRNGKVIVSEFYDSSSELT